MFILLNLTQFHFTYAALRHSPLPSCLPPTFEVLIDALAFYGPQTQDSHHLPLAESVQVVEERHQRIAADHCPRGHPLEETTQRREEVLVVAERLRLAKVFRNNAVQEKEGPARHFGPSTDQEPLQEFITPPKRKLLMADVVRPLARFAQEPPGMACRSV